MGRKLCLVFMMLAVMLQGCAKEETKKVSDYSDVTEIMSDKEEYQEFITKVEEYYEKCEFNGCILVAMGDEIILAKGYGLSDLADPQSKPLTIHSTFEAGSITKQITAACILQLEQEGKLSTKDTLAKYYETYEYKDEVTIDSLLYMRSGLVDHIEDPYVFYPKDIAEQVWNAELNGTPLPKDITIQYFQDVPLREDLKDKFFYCNLNYRLLADIIEQVSGEEYDQYVKKHIFDVADMKESNLDFQGTTTVGRDGGGKYYSIPKATVMGAGDLNCSVLDLYNWDRALLDYRILSKEQTEKMITPNGTYACGLFNGSGTILHGGSTDVFNSYNCIYTNDDMIIITLINKPIENSNSTTISTNTRKIWQSLKKNKKEE